MDNSPFRPFVVIQLSALRFGVGQIRYTVAGTPATTNGFPVIDLLSQVKYDSRNVAAWRAAHETIELLTKKLGDTPARDRDGLQSLSNALNAALADCDRLVSDEITAKAREALNNAARIVRVLDEMAADSKEAGNDD